MGVRKCGCSGREAGPDLPLAVLPVAPPTHSYRPGFVRAEFLFAYWNPFAKMRSATAVGGSVTRSIQAASEPAKSDSSFS